MNPLFLAGLPTFLALTVPAAAVAIREALAETRLDVGAALLPSSIGEEVQHVAHQVRYYHRTYRGWTYFAGESAIWIWPILVAEWLMAIFKPDGANALSIINAAFPQVLQAIVEATTHSVAVVVAVYLAEFAIGAIARASRNDSARQHRSANLVIGLIAMGEFQHSVAHIREHTSIDEIASWQMSDLNDANKKMIATSDRFNQLKALALELRKTAELFPL